MTPTQIGFLFLALIALLGAIGVVFLHTPVRAAMALVVNSFTLGLIYFVLGNEFIGITQIMVYAGAIMVLFVFVIMILRSGGESDRPQIREGKFIAALLASGIVAGTVYRFIIAPTMRPSVPSITHDYGSPQAIGRVLFTQYVWPFEVTSILLLVGIVGSILLAKRKF